MKKITALFLALCLCTAILTVFTACDESPAENPDSSQVDSNSIGNASPVIHADITSEELLDRFDKIYTFGEDEIENYVLWCETEMTDFYIVALKPDAESWTTDGAHLFDAEKISTNEAINYKRMVPEGFPSDAIVYTVNGKTYMYAVSFNGKDGGISLIEIDRLTVSTTTTKTTTTTTTTTPDSKEILIEAYWVNDDFDICVREMTIESDSKWHVWRALKSLNKQIPSKCSLKDVEMVKGRNGVMILDFSEEFKSLDGSMNGRFIMQAIANTYITTYDLTAIRFKVEGEYLEGVSCGYSEEFGYTEC